jgi:hypothetical protein
MAISLATAISNAQAQAAARGLGPEATARLIAETIDTWQSRWGNPQALCDGLGRPINQ